MSLRRFAQREMTWRELRDFVNNLPRDSATHRDVFGEAAGWTPDTYLLADVFDLHVAMNTEKGKTPKRYPRPVIPTSE